MELTQQQIDNLSLVDIANNPNNYPEEIICLSIDLISDLERQLKDAKRNITENIIVRMKKNNATKIPFADRTTGELKTLTLKTSTPKLNTAIKDYESYIKQNGFEPLDLGEVKFIPYGWSKIKEIRKQGGEIQVLCDELYQEGNPSVEIK
jgi:hypothetical protein